MTTAFGYNINLAVEARRLLMLETTPYEECMRLVYEPTLQLLRELLSSNPAELICLRGPIVSSGKGKGSYCDLDIVGPQNQIAYIGTIRDQVNAVDKWQWFMKINSLMPERVELLMRRGKMAIIRNRIRCDIPVPFLELDLPAMEEGLRRFRQTYLPHFNSITPKVVWFERRLQQRIERQIRNEAQERAKPQTNKERYAVLDMDKF